jgi:hypothetical protein
VIVVFIARVVTPALDRVVWCMCTRRRDPDKRIAGRVDRGGSPPAQGISVGPAWGQRGANGAARGSMSAEAHIP